MRIIHFLYDHPENPWLGGGGAVRAHLINNLLVKKGYEVTMISGGFAANDDLNKNFNVIYTPRLIGYLGSRMGFSFFAFLYSLKYKADIVIDDTSCYSPSFAFLKWRKPKIAFLHHLNGPSSKVKFGVLGGIISVVEKFNLKRYKNLITISSQATKEAISIGFERRQLNQIEAGVHLPDNLELLNKSQRKNQVLFLGRLDVYNKGLDVLSNIWKLISSKDVELLMAGSGKDEEKVKELFSGINNVRFLGRVSENQKNELYKNSLCVIMPSRYEGWGMVSLESMAYGTPCIASNIEGLKDAYGLNASKDLIDLDDVKSWCEKINLLLSDSEYWAETSQRQRDRAEKFSWDITVEKQISLMYRLVNKNGTV